MESVSDLSMTKILLVQRISNRTLREKLLGEGYTLHAEETLGDAFKVLATDSFNIVILCLNFCESKCLDNLDSLVRRYGNLPVVVLVSDNQEYLGKEAVKNGAIDYILESESQSPQLVKRVIRYALDKKEHAGIQKDHERVLNLARKVSKIGSWSWYPKTDTLIPTPTFLEVFDLDEGNDQYALHEFLETVHADDREKLKETLYQLALQRKLISVEFRILSSTNVFKHVFLKGKPADDTTTGEFMYYGTVQDITEIKETSETLIQKNRFLELSGEIASIGGWEFDIRTKELYWTRASYDIHGKAEDYVPSFANLQDLYPPEYVHQMTNSFYSALSDNQDIFLEAPLETGTHTKWLQYIGKIIFEDEKPVKINGIVYDISKSKRQVKNLELNAMMLDNVVEAAIAIDRNYNIVFWNTAAETMFGYSRAQALGKPIDSFDLTEVKPEEIRRIIKFLKDGKNVSDEYIMKDKSGRRFPIRGSLSAIMGNNGAPEALLCLARDISQEKNHLKSIEDSELRFRRLFEYSPVGKGLIDLETFKWVDANNTLVKLLGYSRKDLLKSTMQDITPPEFSKLDLFHLKKLNRHGVFGPYQKEYYKGDGTRIKVIITGFIMNQAMGQKAWVHVLDITELDEKTESLRKSEERFRDYVENATDIILTIDGNGLVDYISPNIKKTMEYSEKEITGRPFLDFIHPDDKREALDVIENAMKNSNEDLSIICRIKHKNGNYLYVQSEGKFRVGPTGEKYGIVISRNVDQAHRSELHVRNQNEILKEIAFIQSHVLRRPLANILGLIALNNLNGTGPKDTLELFDLIQKEAVIMDEVVEDIVSKSTYISNRSNNE